MSNSSVQRAPEHDPGHVPDPDPNPEAAPPPPPGPEDRLSWPPPTVHRPWKPQRRLPPWRPSTVAAVLVTALLAELAFRVTITSLASTLAVLGAVVVIATSRRLESLAQLSATALLVGAALLFTVRDSPWVASMSLAAILALLFLLAGDGLVLGQRLPWRRSVRDGLIATFDVAPWLVEAVRVVGGRSSGRLSTWLRAAIVGGTIALVLGALLASGDAAFGEIVSIIDVGSGLDHLVATLLLVLPVAALALLAGRSEAELAVEPSAPRWRVESLTALWSVAVVLLLWCGVQVAVVSGGARSVLAEQGITAAEYAREGFFQLVAVAALSLTVLNVAHRLARTELTPARDQRLPAVVIGGALIVLIAVSYSRLGYYVDAFGLTMLRLSVATCLGWIALMTVLSVARSLGVNHERNWLPSAAVLSAALFAVVFGFANPERRVAQINLERASITDPVDERYLTRELGADAKPAVAEYAWARLGGMPESVSAWLCEDEPDVGFGLFGWNRSRAGSTAADCS